MISAICSAACTEVHISAAAIRIAQPAMFCDAQDAQTRRQLRLTNGLPAALAATLSDRSPQARRGSP